MSKINEWLNAEKKKAADTGEHIFMGIPDSWFEPRPIFCCENGHVSLRFLKSEALLADVCLTCMKPVRICPPNTTEDQLNLILKGDNNG